MNYSLLLPLTLHTVIKIQVLRMKHKKDMSSYNSASKIVQVNVQHVAGHFECLIIIHSTYCCASKSIIQPSLYALLHEHHWLCMYNIGTTV